MNSREAPYKISQTQWKMILGNTNIIPMNQRNYDWKDEQITKFLSDLFDLFDGKKYTELLGDIIYFSGNADGKEVWDGQQRMITTILIICCINKLAIKINTEDSLKFSSKIMNFMSEDTDMMANVPSIIKNFLIKFDTDGTYKNIPKINCVNHYDHIAICDIYNTYKPLIDYDIIHQEIIMNDDADDDENDDYDNDYDDDGINDDDEDGINDDEDEGINNDNDEDDSKSCKCIACKKTLTNSHSKNGNASFIRHLKTCISYDNDKYLLSENTNIYKAYEFICKKMYNKKYTLKKLKQLYQYILNNIDIQLIECNNLDYVSRIFEQRNNRGLPVGSIDVIKNMLLSNIAFEKRQEIFNKWSENKSKKHSIYKDYGEKIFNCAIQIYNKEMVSNIEKNITQEEKFKKLIIKEKNGFMKTYNNIKVFFDIVDALFRIMEEIESDRFGRLIFYGPKCAIQWQGLSYLLLPIFYNKKTIDIKLIKLVTKWFYRNITCKIRNFANFGYLNEFIIITNTYIKNNTYDYYEEIVRVFRKNTDNVVSEDNYINTFIEKQWKQTSRTYAKMLLYFYETCKQNDDVFPILKHDLEHIHPESNKISLKYNINLHKLGNLTPFESKNSDNGHKGNRSVKDTLFENKKVYYKDSSHLITRELVDYNKFSDKEIEFRTLKIFTELNKLTRY